MGASETHFLPEKSYLRIREQELGLMLIKVASSLDSGFNYSVRNPFSLFQWLSFDLHKDFALMILTVCSFGLKRTNK